MLHPFTTQFYHFLLPAAFLVLPKNDVKAGTIGAHYRRRAAISLPGISARHASRRSIFASWRRHRRAGRLTAVRGRHAHKPGTPGTKVAEDRQTVA